MCQLQNQNDPKTQGDNDATKATITGFVCIARDDNWGMGTKIP
jgi:hypothetical protein